MKTIKVIEVKKVEHTIEVTGSWPSNQTPEEYLSKAVENVGFDWINKIESKNLQNTLEYENGEPV